MKNLGHYEDLKGASVFITGGASGIGAAITEAFLIEGADVSFVDLDDNNADELCDRMAQKVGRRPTFYHLDVRDVGALQEVIRSVKRDQGDLHVLVNNAARDDRHELAGFSPDQWDESLNNNLRPYFFTAQAVAASMIKRGGGSVINLSSNAFMLGLSGYPAYVTAKAGIWGLTKALARELGPSGIRVNCLVPGWVMTERQKELWVTEAALDECLTQQCLKETIHVDDIAAACLFLASQSSRMMSGQSLIVDGGRV